jgi:integrase
MADLIPKPQDKLAHDVQKGTNPALVYLASLGTEKSRRTQYDSLQRVLRIIQAPVAVGEFPWWQLSFEHLQLVRTSLSEGYAPATANLSLCAIRGVLRMAWRMEMISTDAYHRLTDFPNVKGSREPKGRHIAQSDVTALFLACDGYSDPWMRSRNAAMVGLLFGLGLRRAELVGLRMDQLDLETGEIIVLGKGNKERKGHLPEGALAATQIWVTQYRPLVRVSRLKILPADGSDCEYVLLSARHGRSKRPMGEGSVLHNLNELARRAGVKRFSPHDFRRTFIGEMLDLGVDIATVQQMVGHASPVTTSRYDRRGDRAKKAAASKLHVPFRQMGGDE